MGMRPSDGSGNFWLFCCSTVLSNLEQETSHARVRAGEGKERLRGCWFGRRWDRGNHDAKLLERRPALMPLLPFFSRAFVRACVVSGRLSMLYSMAFIEGLVAVSAPQIAAKFSCCKATSYDPMPLITCGFVMNFGFELLSCCLSSRPLDRRAEMSDASATLTRRSAC